MIMKIRAEAGSARQQDARDPVRPERFAWTDEEALIIFGTGFPLNNRQLMPSGNEESSAGTRIQIAGRFDPRISDIRVALEAAQDAVSNRFVIIERAAHHFMQCLCTEAGWIVEKQEGDEQHHYRALVRPDEPDRKADGAALLSRLFSNRPQPALYMGFDQVLEAMQHYHDEVSEPQWLEWIRIEI